MRGKTSGSSYQGAGARDTGALWAIPKYPALCGSRLFGPIGFGLEGCFARITQSPCERPACRVEHGGATKLSRDETPGRRCRLHLNQVRTPQSACGLGPG
jgi:hypothetical protein